MNLYRLSTTIWKALRTAVISGATAGGTAQAMDVSDRDSVIIAVTSAIVTGALRGYSNWSKNRNK